MHLQLDPQHMRAAMDLWRQELAHGQRADAGRLRDTVAGWLDLLRLCRPAQADADEFQRLAGDVEQFREWLHEAELAERLMRP